MDSLRQYIISVVAAAILCGIVTGLLPKGTSKEITKLVCGLFLAFTVLHPIAGFDVSSLPDFRFSFSEDAAETAALGEKIAHQEIADIIKTETEAYILDKAASLNAELTVEVTVSSVDTPVPVSARLSGEVSPHARQQLQSMLQSDLGIAKENQLWTGQN